MQNIEALSILGISYSSSNDHSKWAVSTDKDWICIGDINRAVRNSVFFSLEIKLLACRAITQRQYIAKFAYTIGPNGRSNADLSVNIANIYACIMHAKLLLTSSVIN